MATVPPFEMPNGGPPVKEVSAVRAVLMGCGVLALFCCLLFAGCAFLGWRDAQAGRERVEAYLRAELPIVLRNWDEKELAKRAPALDAQSAMFEQLFSQARKHYGQLKEIVWESPTAYRWHTNIGSHSDIWLRYPVRFEKGTTEIGVAVRISGGSLSIVGFYVFPDDARELQLADPKGSR